MALAMSMMILSMGSSQLKNSPSLMSTSDTMPFSQNSMTSAIRSFSQQAPTSVTMLLCLRSFSSRISARNLR